MAVLIHIIEADIRISVMMVIWISFYGFIFWFILREEFTILGNKRFYMWVYCIFTVSPSPRLLAEKFNMEEHCDSHVLERSYMKYRRGVALAFLSFILLSGLAMSTLSR